MPAVNWKPPLVFAAPNAGTPPPLTPPPPDEPKAGGAFEPTTDPNEGVELLPTPPNVG